MENYIQNSQLFIDVIGKFPSFHDAEVLEINLKRREPASSLPTLRAIIQVVVVTRQNTENGVSFLHHKFDVDLTFTHIFGLKLENFNHQNVISGLYISDFSDDYWKSMQDDERLLGVVSQKEINGLNYYVKFEYCFGIEAEFLCGSIIVNSVLHVAN